MLITLVLFFGVIIISLILAFLSMRNYQEVPTPNLNYTLFLVRNPANINFQFFQKLHQMATPLEAVISLERLFKGKDSALVLYGPQNLVQHFPELSLLELEDYLAEKEDINFTSCWSYNATPPTKTSLIKIPNFFSQLSLKDHQQFIWQIVLFPIRTTTDSFQTTIRSLVVDPDPNERINLVKETQTLIEQATGLDRPEKAQPSGIVYEAFKKRTLIPKEVSHSILNAGEIFSLLTGGV